MYAAIIGALSALAGGTAKAVKAKNQKEDMGREQEQANAAQTTALTASAPRPAAFGAQAPVPPPGANQDPMLQAPDMQKRRPY